MSQRRGSLLRVFSPLLFRRLAPSLPSRSQFTLPACASHAALFSAWSTSSRVVRRFASSHSQSISSSCNADTVVVPLDASVTTITTKKNKEEEEAGVVEDPVFPWVLRGRMPLTQLAKLLPDDVLEKLEGGLKSHLERFPERYRLFRDANGILHAQCIRPADMKRSKSKKRNTVVEKVCKKRDTVDTCLLHNIPRFFTLESLMRSISSDCPAGGNCNTSLENDKKNEDLDAMEQLICEQVFTLSDVELWILTEEYTLVKSPASPPGASVGKSEEQEEVEETMIKSEGTVYHETDTRNTTPEKEVLQAFRWKKIADKKELNGAMNALRSENRGHAVADEMNGEEMSSKSTLMRGTFFVRFASSTAFSEAGKVVLRPHSAGSGIEEYNVFRMCRALSTKTFMSLPELQDVVGEWLTQPLAAVLAIGKEEAKMCLHADGIKVRRPFLEFESDPNDQTRILGVRFWLDEEQYIPSEYHNTARADLEKELSQLGVMTSRRLSKLPNYKRVAILDRRRILQRCVALHDLGTSPLCHPDVLAYYLFDLLPLDGQMILAGLLPQVLPESIRRITDARSRAWLRKYPHLFRLVENPPEIYVQRMDVPVSGEKGEEGHKGEGKTGVVESSSKTHEDYMEKLLTDPEEQLRLMISVVAARLEICGTRKLIPSHLPKFVNSEVRRKMMPRGSGGIIGYLKRYPDVFVLTYGIHPHEPVITFAAKYNTDCQLSSANVTADTNMEGDPEK